MVNPCNIHIGPVYDIQFTKEEKAYNIMGVLVKSMHLPPHRIHQTSSDQSIFIYIALDCNRNNKRIPDNILLALECICPIEQQEYNSIYCSSKKYRISGMFASPELRDIVQSFFK